VNRFIIIERRQKGTFFTAAVSPTAEAPCPVVYTARYAIFSIYLLCLSEVQQIVLVERIHMNKNNP
jgi:hypothetical protein